ncbi:tetratricopeptide repeat protein [Roseibium sp.]|uniref:tetratricopeptide repeat protein n=1 Tax=Roseibium sp. TaxID=1936156 RepID=UPI003263C457
MAAIDDIITSQDLQLLADIGFIAGSRGMNDHANAIFEAIRALRPEQEAGFLGSAMIRILAGDPGAAIKELEKAPTTVATRTFLGIALVQQGNVPRGREVLEAVVSTAPDTPFAHLAETTLTDIQA